MLTPSLEMTGIVARLVFPQPSPVRAHSFKSFRLNSLFRKDEKSYREFSQLGTYGHKDFEGCLQFDGIIYSKILESL